MTQQIFSPPLKGQEQENTGELRPVFNEQGLIAAVAQDVKSGEVLMLAWMNAQSLQETLASGRAVYWSRSRKSLWRKGETSGHIQQVCELRLDCDQDTVLLKVRQTGAACHTGRKSCFYRIADADGSLQHDL